ncbi:hypothetical protein IIA15_00985 [candidate division TA06 bacterium]|nr:hypothetical protein [candidate division TA06 bacterium]
MTEDNIELHYAIMRYVMPEEYFTNVSGLMDQIELARYDTEDLIDELCKREDISRHEIEPGLHPKILSTRASTVLVIER